MLILAGHESTGLKSKHLGGRVRRILSLKSAWATEKPCLKVKTKQKLRVMVAHSTNPSTPEAEGSL